MFLIKSQKKQQINLIAYNLMNTQGGFMKDKRNCGAPYPIYPPVMGIPNMPYMTGYQQGYTNNSLSSNTVETQINNLEQQMTNLETRVSRLENMLNTNKNNSQYNGSNYYMV